MFSVSLSSMAVQCPATELLELNWQNVYKWPDLRSIYI